MYEGQKEDNLDLKISITEWPPASVDSDQSSPDKEWPEGPSSDQSTSDVLHLNSSSSYLKRQITTQDRESKRLKESEESSDSEPFAASRIAKWWRKRQHLVNGIGLESKNPNTLLHHISKTAECQEFLKDEVKSLRRQLSKAYVRHRASLYAAIASIDDWLGLYDQALENITTAVTLCDTNPEFLWLKEKLTRQCKVMQVQWNMTWKLNSSSRACPVPEKVDRVKSKHLSVQDFKTQYVRQHKPVIIEGVVDAMTSEKWNLQHIKSKAGSVKVSVRHHVAGSTEWARLEEEKLTTVAEHIESIEREDTRSYLFDWSLPLHCPQLADEITIPDYFQDNFLTRTEPGSLYHDSWPSLFVAPAGIISDLHVDAFGSSFWMALFQGEKRWTFFDPADVPLLYPNYQQSLDAVFSVDLTKPDMESFPLLSLSKPKQCILKPGDLLFVPAGSPHFVENLSPSVAVSSNYVDDSNCSQVCEELRISGFLDPRASQLLEQLQSSEFRKRVMPDCQFGRKPSS